MDRSLRNRATVWIISALIALFLAALTVRLVVSWRNYGDLDHNAPGTWVAMAVDARFGLLYRPVVSAVGYGGTRYAPLLVIVQSALIRAGLDPFASGFMTGIASAALMVSALFILMRRMRLPVPIAALLAVAALAPSCVRINILGIRGDLLPPALTLWGFIAILFFGESENPARRKFAIMMAGILFALATFTKITSVFGIATAAIWLLINRKYAQALIICLVWAIALFLFAGITEWASSGRALEIFRLCATAGGSITQILHGPHKLLYDAWENDRIFLAIFFTAAILFLASTKFNSLPTVFLVVTTIGTAIIFGSPGTKFNHLADMITAALLFIAFQYQQGNRFAPPAVFVTTVFLAVASVACMQDARFIRHEAVRTRMEQAIADSKTSPASGPLLSEDPLIPVMRGERPYLTDSFMFRVIRNQRPAISRKMWDDLDHHYFSAVILHAEPTNELYRDANNGDFGPGFIDHLLRDYSCVAVRGHLYVYFPNDSASHPQEISQKLPRIARLP